MQEQQRTLAEKKPDPWLSITLRALLLGIFLWMVRGLLIPLILGALVALIFFPLQRRLVPKLGKAAPIAPGLLTAGAVVLVVIPLVLFVLKAISSINEFLTRDWEQTFTQAQSFVTGRLSFVIERFHLNTESFYADAQRVAKNGGGALAGWLGNAVRNIPEQIVDVFLFLLALYFFLRDGRALTRWLLKLSPFAQDDTEELFSSIRETVNGAILGTLVTAAVQGALTMLALYIFGVPGAFLLGILATALAFIPMVGTTPVTFGATIYLFLTSKVGAGVGMLVAAIIVGVSDNVVRPWVQSSRGTMHPLIALISIFGGLNVFGAAGIFIGPVVAAMALWIVDTYAELRLKQRLRIGGLPAPSAEASAPEPSPPQTAPPALASQTAPPALAPPAQPTTAQSANPEPAPTGEV